MSDGIVSPEPPTGKPFDDFCTDVAELTVVSIGDILVAEEENPGWYKVEINLSISKGS